MTEEVLQHMERCTTLARELALLIVTLVSLFGLSACTLSSPAPDMQPQKNMFKAGIGIVNHTDRYIYSTAVNGEWGGHAHKLSAGIANFCCVILPRKWHSGLMIKVDWDMPVEATHIYKSNFVEVEQYDEPGEVYLHFFPDDKVRAVVTMWVGASPNHPIPPPPGTKTYGSE